MSHPTSSTSRKSSRSAPATQTTQVSQGNKAKGKDEKKPGRIKGREIQKLGINDLSNEILFNIFSRLSPITIGKVVKLVCSNWFNIGSDASLWKIFRDQELSKESKTGGSRGESLKSQDEMSLKALVKFLDQDQKLISGNASPSLVVTSGNISEEEKTVRKIYLEQEEKYFLRGTFELGIDDTGRGVEYYSSKLGKLISYKEVVQKGKAAALQEEQDCALGTQIVADLFDQYDNDDKYNNRRATLDMAFFDKVENSNVRKAIVEWLVGDQIFVKLLPGRGPVPRSDYPDFFQNDSLKKMKTIFLDYKNSASVTPGYPSHLFKKILSNIGKIQRETVPETLEQEERDYTLGLKTEVAKLERQKKFQLPPEYTSKYKDPSIALYVIATYSREELISIGIKARENEGSSSSAAVIEPQSVEPKKKDNEAAIDKAQKEAYDAGLNDLIEHYKEIFPTTNIEAIEQQVLKDNTPAEIASWGFIQVLGKNKPKTAKVPIKKPTEKKAIAKEVKRIDKKYKDDEYTYGTKKRGKKKVVESSSSSSSDSDDSSRLKRKGKKNRKK